MTNKYKKYKEELNRRIYGNKTLTELKRIGKKKGLLNVDQYSNADKNILVERLVKGRQLSDEDKPVLVEIGKNKNLLVNTSMNKEKILSIISNPKLTDFNETRLRKLAEEKGIKLRDQMSKTQIIERLENPTKHYDKQHLKNLANNNNIKIPKNIKRQP